MPCSSQPGHRKSLGDLPVTMTLLMRAAASCCNTGFVSCFRLFSITRRPKNSSSDSAPSLGARKETHIAVSHGWRREQDSACGFWSTGKPCLVGNACSATQPLGVQDTQCSTSASNSAASAKLLICYIAVSRKAQCSIDACAEGQGFAASGWLKPTDCGVQNFYCSPNVLPYRSTISSFHYPSVTDSEVQLNEPCKSSSKAGN